MTKKDFIARGIGKKLEEFGWNVFERSEICTICSKNESPSGANFCSNCGEQLEPDYEETSAIDELYKAYTAGKRTEEKWNENSKRAEKKRDGRKNS